MRVGKKKSIWAWYTTIHSINELLQISRLTSFVSFIYLFYFFLTPSTCHKHLSCKINYVLSSWMLCTISKRLYSPVWGFWEQIMNNVTCNISYGNVDVTKVDVVRSNLSSIIAWFFPVQYKAHRGWKLIGIHVLILQHGEDGDCIGYRRRDSAGHQITVGPSSCLVNSLCDKITFL